MKKLQAEFKKKYSDEEVKELQNKHAAFFKKVLGNFKDYEFYVGPKMDPEAM
jgi:hypothetical protein